MTWLTFMEYLCHKWPQIWSVCRKHNLALSSFMTSHRISNNSDPTDETCWAGVTTFLEDIGSLSVCSGVLVAWSLIFCVVVCCWLLLLVILAVFFMPSYVMSFDLRLLIIPNRIFTLLSTVYVSPAATVIYCILKIQRVMNVVRTGFDNYNWHTSGVICNINVP